MRSQRRSQTALGRQDTMFVSPHPDNLAGLQSTVQPTTVVRNAKKFSKSETTDAFLKRQSNLVEAFIATELKTTDDDNLRLETTNKRLIADLEEAVDMLLQQSAALEEEAEGYKKLSEEKFRQSGKIKKLGDELCKKLGRPQKTGPPIEIDD